MKILAIISVAIAGSVFFLIVLFKLRNTIKVWQKKRADAHRKSIAPSLSFYTEATTLSDMNKTAIKLKNVGIGTALNIRIDDFHHPKERDWLFKFNDIVSLEPDKNAIVDFDFFVGKHEAFNKYDMIWMFDPDHADDFIARMEISYEDIEENRYQQTISIGEGKQNADMQKALKNHKKELLKSILPL